MNILRPKGEGGPAAGRMAGRVKGSNFEVSLHAALFTFGQGISLHFAMD